MFRGALVVAKTVMARERDREREREREHVSIQTQNRQQCTVPNLSIPSSATILMAGQGEDPPCSHRTGTHQREIIISIIEVTATNIRG